MINLKMFKHSILDLAVQGKLSHQSVNDESVSDLLLAIANSKRKLIQAKKIPNIKASSKIKDNEIPFKIPSNWQWTRLNTLTEVNLGSTPAKRNKSYWNNGTIPWVSVSDLNNGHIKHTINHITKKATQNAFRSKPISAKGTLLMSFKLTIGKMGILDKPMYHNEAIASLPFYYKNDTLKQYMFYVLPILCHYVRITPAVKGKTLNKAKLRHMLVPLPPLNEQKQIVFNIKKCYGLADLMKRRYEFRANFIHKMRESLLQLAIQGKLTKQSANDGNINDQLQDIKQRKQHIIKVNKIRKTKAIPPVNENKVPFKIPNNWKWIRLNDVSLVRSGKRVPKGMKLDDKPTPDSVPYLRVRDMNPDTYTVNASNIKYANKAIVDRITKYRINHHDIYIVVVGGSIGKFGIIPKKLDNILLTENANRITPVMVNRDYLFDLFLSKFMQNYISKVSHQVAQPKLSLTNLRSLMIPLPPLPEQQRIVKVLKHLFSELKFK